VESEQGSGAGRDAARFEAECVVVAHPDGECHLVGFADRKFGTQVYLMLHRAFEFDEQDVDLGMDTYHVEWCDQRNSGYGGIERFELRPGGADVMFDAMAREEMDGLARVSIAFALDIATYEALKAALGEIFAGTDCLRVHAG
jgi:hypothetical protein